MQIVDEIVKKTAFGGGGGKKDDSVDNPMNYAERFILNKDFLEMAGKLTTSVTVGKTVKGGSIMLDQSDFPTYFKEGTEGMNGVCHKLNQVFVASGFPLYATSYSTDDAEKTVKEKTRGKHKGDSYKLTIADRIRVYRISNDFDVNKYACDDSDKVKVKGITNYHQYTTGMYLREQKWLHENYPELKDTLESLGYKE